MFLIQILRVSVYFSFKKLCSKDFYVNSLETNGPTPFPLNEGGEIQKQNLDSCRDPKPLKNLRLP